MATRHLGRHHTNRVGWLRAAVLGANEGISSTASLVEGARSLATGEYVSVRSQAAAEQADLTREQEALRTDPVAEQPELAARYVQRGLAPALATQVAQQLMAREALGTHAHEELGFSETIAANPLQVALASAASFPVGAALPVAPSRPAPAAGLGWTVTVTALLFLAALGALVPQVGGSEMGEATPRYFLGRPGTGLNGRGGPLLQGDSLPEASLPRPKPLVYILLAH